jgi:RNA polymerase sigma-70 factor (ECF subfamily)
MKPGRPSASQDDATFADRIARLYGEDLLWFLLARLKNEQDAKDVVQETYLRLLRLGKGELVRDPRAYVYFVARQVLAQFRLRARRTPITYDSALTGHHDRYPGQVPEDTVAAPLMALREAETLLDALPALHRKVFVLRTFEGLSWAEIAGQLGISVHTVKKYLCDANARISMMRRE